MWGQEPRRPEERWPLRAYFMNWRDRMQFFGYDPDNIVCKDAGPGRFIAARLSIVKAGKSAAGKTHQVAAQGLAASRQAGRQIARTVIAAQRAARLDPRLIRESLRSLMLRPASRQSDVAWRQAYTAEAERLLSPRSDAQAQSLSGPAAAFVIPAQPVGREARPLEKSGADMEAGS
jgi:hypothetical protein